MPTRKTIVPGLQHLGALRTRAAVRRAGEFGAAECADRRGVPQSCRVLRLNGNFREPGRSGGGTERRGIRRNDVPPEIFPLGSCRHIPMTRRRGLRLEQRPGSSFIPAEGGGGRRQRKGGPAENPRRSSRSSRKKSKANRRIRPYEEAHLKSGIPDQYERQARDPENLISTPTSVSVNASDPAERSTLYSRVRYSKHASKRDGGAGSRSPPSLHIRTKAFTCGAQSRSRGRRG